MRMYVLVACACGGFIHIREEVRNKTQDKDISLSRQKEKIENTLLASLHDVVLLIYRPSMDIIATMQTGCKRMQKGGHQLHIQI